jgi:ADP-heptose:LPS heptosyltransferase
MPTQLGKRLERRLKHVVLAAVAGAPEPPLDPAACSLAALRRVVVVRQDRRLGNLVLLTSLLLGLRRAAPEARITVVAPAAFAPVLRPHPAVDRVIPIDHRRLLRRPWEVASLRRILRGEDAELAIDAGPHHSASVLNGILTRATGARFRLGYDREGARAFLNLRVPLPEAQDPESVLLHDLLRLIAKDLPPAPPPAIAVPRASRALLAQTCQRLGLPTATAVVGMHPGGRRGKRWAIERFAAVAAELNARGIAVVVFSGPAERPLLFAMAPPGALLVFAPPTDVDGLRTYLAGVDAFVSGDCGPMHLAAALGVPCVSIFRVGDFARYAPVGAQHAVLYRAEGEVEPAAVVDAVLRVLSRRGDVRPAACSQGAEAAPGSPH